MEMINYSNRETSFPLRVKRFFLGRDYGEEKHKVSA